MSNQSATPALLARRAYRALTEAIRSDHYSDARYNVVLLARENACFDVAARAERDSHRTFRVITGANMSFWTPDEINALKVASGARGCTLVLSKDCFADDGSIANGLGSLIGKCVVVDTSAFA